jgi:hypothetical protein
MSLKCYYQYDDGRFCKLWAMHGSRFCQNHQPPSTPDETAKLPLHPGLRLTSPKDVLHILSEALLGAHVGTMSPGKAYSTGYLAMAWMKTWARVSLDAQEKAVRHQMLVSMVDRSSAELASDPQPPAAEAAHPPAAQQLAHDPWAAGRMAGPVPVPDTHAHPDDRSGTPAEPVHLQEAQARLAELLGFLPDDDHEPLTPPSPVAAGLPRHNPQDAPRCKPNGSPARLRKSRDPAA